MGQEDQEDQEEPILMVPAIQEVQVDLEVLVDQEDLVKMILDAPTVQTVQEDPVAQEVPVGRVGQDGMRVASSHAVWELGTAPHFGNSCGVDC